PCDARGRARGGQRRRRDRGRPSLGSRRELATRSASRCERPVARSRLHRGGTRLVSTSGLYGTYGGRYVPETLVPALDELEAGWLEARSDESFRADLDELGRAFGGRPTPLTRAERFAPDKRLYLKREDLLHTGAHKLNNALGQAVLAGRLGKRRIVAETGAGQPGVATATVWARFRLDCVAYLGR